MNRRPPYTDCQIYVDGIPELQVGDYLRTPAGSAYLAAALRQNRRRAYRRHLRCVRWPVDAIPDDATVFELHWYARAKRAARRLSS